MRALALVLLLSPTVTFACWNEVRLSADEEVKAVALAEAALQRGAPAEALKTLRALYGKQAIFRPDRISTDKALGQKARGLIAIATIRAQRFDPKTGRPAGKNRQRQVRRLVTDALHAMLRDAPDDPVRKARYAEALARDPAQAAKARALLEALAKADLIADAEAWRALANLRTAAGDLEAAVKAAERCVLVAKADRCLLSPVRVR